MNNELNWIELNYIKLWIELNWIKLKWKKIIMKNANYRKKLIFKLNVLKNIIQFENENIFNKWKWIWHWIQY